MRISVSVVVRQIAHGASVEQILRGYPDPEAADVRQAIEYAAWLSEEEVHAPRSLMRFLVDACVDVRVADWPRSEGHDAVHLRERALQRLGDEEVIRKAGAAGRAIVTFDLDFSEIAALSAGRHAGIIVFRLHDSRHENVIARPAAVLARSAAALERGAVIGVEEDRHRARFFPAREPGNPWEAGP